MHPTEHDLILYRLVILGLILGIIWFPQCIPPWLIVMGMGYDWRAAKEEAICDDSTTTPCLALVFRRVFQEVYGLKPTTAAN